jgi:hypothetical protein
MEATNYLRSLIEMSLRAKRSIPKEYSSSIFVGHTAPKFALPHGGRILDNNLEDLPEKIRLPYPVVVIEYPCLEYPLSPILDLLPPDKLGEIRPSEHGHDRMIVIATQVNDEPIRVLFITRRIGTDVWVYPPFTISIAQERKPEVGSTTGLWLHVERHSEEALAGMSEEWFMKVAGAMSKAPMRAVYELCEALSVNHVTVTELPARKPNRAARRRGALDYDSYRVLTIQPRSEPTLPSGETRDHRSPREHERRGHWRRYKSGKEVFIEKLTINKGVGGKVIKDYQLKT